jgi:hypothetical protein
MKIIFFFKFTLGWKQSDIVPIICHRCINYTSGTGGKKFAAGDVDTNDAL